MPFVHVWPAPQRTLQPPQFAGSLEVVTQRPLQNVEPAGHAQVPLVHDVPMGQMKPHTPQFALSVLVLLQVPLQLICPTGQTLVHMRFEHDAPGAQVMPQPPQLRGSLSKFTHDPSGH